MMDWGVGGPWMFGGGLLMVGFWVLIVLAAVALIRWLGLGSAGTSGKSALDVLKDRYARGELGRDDYQQMRRDLEA
jgi:putative membrane protein